MFSYLWIKSVTGRVICLSDIKMIRIITNGPVSYYLAGINSQNTTFRLLVLALVRHNQTARVFQKYEAHKSTYHMYIQVISILTTSITI